MARSSPEWDLDSDEIASVASQDLHDNRPNRWRGSRSTWRTITEEERRLWGSMKMLEDRDLAMHLYNAFALKRRGRDAATVSDVTVTMDNGQQVVWAPPKVWTAWPLNERRVPQRRLIRREENREDEGFTFRKREDTTPSSELQDELSAMILRLAKEKFYSTRKKRLVFQSIEMDAAGSEEEEEEEEEEDGEEEEDEDESMASSDGGDDSGSSSESSDHVKQEGIDIHKNIKNEYDDEYDIKDNAPRAKRKRKQPKMYTAIPSTDDDRSHDLLKQPVRHILTQLDRALTVLHNARSATADYASDSSATDSESGSQSGSKVSRPRGRPRSRSVTAAPSGGEYASSPRSNATATAAAAPSARKKGRPKKVHIPRPGETHEEMIVRVARQSHRKIPATAAEDREAAFEAWLRRGDEKIARERALRREEEEAGIEAGASTQERKMRRLGLRDWSDVVGAAALAGFSAEVVARTAKRCAALFGEGVTLRRLDEGPAHRHPGFQTMSYRPEAISLSDLESSGTSDEEPDRGRRSTTAASRPFSPFPRGASSEPQSHHHGRTMSRSRSRSRSRSVAGFFLCTVPTCERSSTGFSRRQNLKRHMSLVHPGHEDNNHNHSDDEESATAAATYGSLRHSRSRGAGSEDEMLGAVHVDGFLKPVLPARGWREGLPPPRSSSSRKRSRSRDRGRASASGGF